VEIIGERTESSSTWALPDGSLQTGTASGPIWVRTGGDGTDVGDWAMVDLTLEPAADGQVAPRAHPAALRLSGGRAADDDRPVAALEDEGVQLTLDWDGPLPQPRLEGPRAVYAGVRPGVDLVVEVTRAGFEQFLVLHRRPAPEERLPVAFDVQGAEPRATSDDGVEFVRPDGTVIGGMPAPLAWDAAVDRERAHPIAAPWVADPRERFALSPRPEPVTAAPEKPTGPEGGARETDLAPQLPTKGRPADNGPGAGRAADATAAQAKASPHRRLPERPAIQAGRVSIDLSPDAAFLQDPAVELPIIVDPEVRINTGFDTWVQHGFSSDQSGSPELRLGTYNGGANVARSFLHFDLAPVAGRQILQGWLDLFNWHSYSCSARNWQVWDTGLAGTGTRIGSQPAWNRHWSTSNKTLGYSSSCNDGWVNADVRGLVQAHADNRRGTVAFGLKAENESDSFGWKKFNSANAGGGIPSVWVQYNTRPDMPTGLGVSPRGERTQTNPDVWAVPTRTPRLSATHRDPDGDEVTAHWRVWGPSGLVREGNRRIPSGTVLTVDLAAENVVLQHGVRYAFSASTSDGRISSGWTGDHLFVVDTELPGAPSVASNAYPNDQSWKPAVDGGSFTVTPRGGDGATHVLWGLNAAPSQRVNVANGSATVTPPKPSDGKHTLNVVAVDAAGNQSAVTRYLFNVGRAGLAHPDDGDRIVRRTRIAVQTNDTTLTHVRFLSRRGPDGGNGAPVPLAHLTRADGTPVTSAWTPVSQLSAGCPQGVTGACAVWDAGATLGLAGGPVQLQAQLAQDGNGTGATPTAWVSLMLDPSGDSAAASDIGPGSVNLLTGDFTLGATDAEEFGLTVGRTASSRAPNAGYEPQAELLKPTQQAVLPEVVLGGCGGGDFGACNVTASRVTTHGRSMSTSGLDALRTVGNGSTTWDTFVSVSGDVGAHRLGMKPGSRYRATAWVFVAGAGGAIPAPATTRGPGLTLHYKGADGAYVEASSPRPPSTNAWHQVSVEFTIPAGATESFLRLYNGYTANSGQVVLFDDLSLREIWAPLGPEWKLGVEAESGAAYTRLSFPETDVAAVELADGGQVWFASTGGADGGRWWPEPGAEDLTLTRPTASLWRLTEIDGTVTEFERRTPQGDWLVARSMPPPGQGQSRYVYETVAGVTRIARIIAPVEDGVDGAPGNTAACSTLPAARGCRLLELSYAAPTTPVPTGSAVGPYPGRLTEVRATAWDPEAATPAMASVAVARYDYDATGALREIRDPRAPGVVTRYDYDAERRVERLTPSGELPWRFTYGQAGPSTTGSGDIVDRSQGRLLKVTRASLASAHPSEPGYNTAGPDVSTSVVYRVPLTRGAGGPYDLTGSAIAAWGQMEAPTDASAVFGPETPVAAHTASGTSPTLDQYSRATVHYLNASGKEVNTASPTGKATDAVGDIDSVEIDRFGNVVRELDATNRRLALGPDTAPELQELNLSSASTATRAMALSSLTTYSPDGLNVITTTGPVRRVAVGNDPANLQVTRARTVNTYDEGKPDAAAYHLVTTAREGALLADGVTLVDVEVTRTQYTPVDSTVGALDPRSGWRHGQPTRVIANAEGAAGERLTSEVRYDQRGRGVDSRRNVQSGAGVVAAGDAGATLTTLWTAGNNAADSECGNRPEWAGLPCATRAAGPASGHDAARMAAAVPVKRVRSYDRMLNPRVVEESATGPLDGATATQTRRTTTTYDAADRIVRVEMGGAGVGGAVVTTTSYDAVTGDSAAVEGSVGGVSTGRVEKRFDQLGRLTRYVDAAGGWTETAFDDKGKPVRVKDSIGTSQSFSYGDPRGLLTSVTDSVAGTITATYGPDGQVLTQDLPGGVRLVIGYDAAGNPVQRTYRRSSDQALVAASSVLENTAGQWIRHATPAATKTYAYDGLGRLTRVQDMLGATGTCVQREYGWNARAGRTSRTTTWSGSSVCAAPGSGAPQEATGWTYDSADRLVSTTGAGASGAWTYDPLGRITAMPVEGTSSVVRNGFFANDRAASQEIAGVDRQTWTLDPLHRVSGSSNFAWDGNAWVGAVNKRHHYDSDSDSPAWIEEDLSLPGEITRYVDGVDGDLAVQTSRTGARVLQLVDLHGDVMGTLPVRDGQAAAAWSELVFRDSDEFGRATDLNAGRTRVTDGSAPARDARYGWLGGKQRSADALGSVLLMGARLYAPSIGRFLSVDPVPGGNATAYDYCSGDPVNCTDLDGQWGMPKSFKKALKVVARVSEYASFIPGPIGAGAAAMGAVAYAATGNRRAALRMGLTAAAAMVGAGAAVKGVSRAVSTARKVGKCNSFSPGTSVVLADGTRVPISRIEAGDLVLSEDPLTGELSAQPVLGVIVGQGDKHLVQITTDGAEPVIATANHPFWVEGRGWVDAVDVRTGNALRTASGVALVQAAHDFAWLSGQTVFNLHVANSHTFFVGAGESAVLVHNASCAIATHTIYQLNFGKFGAYVGRTKLTVPQRYRGHPTRTFNGQPVRARVTVVSQVRGCTCAARRAEQLALDRARARAAAGGPRVLNRRQEIAKRNRWKFGI
jgi:RHS repeat-associated protein